LFIPEVIYEHGEPWWKDIDRETLNYSSRSLWPSYQQSYLAAKQEELSKKMMNFIL
jgi:hypothetical protein